jgi:hypothetical protein
MIESRVRTVKLVQNSVVDEFQDLCRRFRYNRGMVGRLIFFIVAALVLSILYVLAKKANQE